MERQRSGSRNLLLLSLVSLLQYLLFVDAFTSPFFLKNHNYHGHGHSHGHGLHDVNGNGKAFLPKENSLSQLSSSTNQQQAEIEIEAEVVSEAEKDNSSKMLQSGYDTIDGYERFLYSKKQKKKNEEKDLLLRKRIKANNKYNNMNVVHDNEDDGYTDMMIKKKRPFLQRLAFAPLKLAMKVTIKVMSKVPEPGKSVQSHFR
mmetsp:Transcript_18107/g.27144  ORF Transcript_18107/g.27144 Transcript_18107/m.27144 type:complete len:202 (-) Transcript_18107:5112-5717(-)